MSSVLFDAPGPRARLRNHVISAVTVVVVVLAAWLVYSKLSAKGQLTAAKWEPFLTANLWKTYVLPGIQGTLTAAAISIVLAGVVLATVPLLLLFIFAGRQLVSGIMAGAVKG